MALLPSVVDRHFMQLAIRQAHLCVSVQSGYNVGAVLVKRISSNNAHDSTDATERIEDWLIISTGYSRELPGNTHAEECCIIKYTQQQQQVEQEHQEHSSSHPVDLSQSFVLYSTMEPCDVRLSGKRSCSTLLIESHISRVVVGALEPSVFVCHCEGMKKLRDAGVDIVLLQGMEKECLEMNNHVLMRVADG